MNNDPAPVTPRGDNGETINAPLGNETKRLCARRFSGLKTCIEMGFDLGSRCTVCSNSGTASSNAEEAKKAISPTE